VPSPTPARWKLDELRTRTYGLDEINAGYDDMRNGRTCAVSSRSEPARSGR
jgi:Zn-dependent alcohol dehydrogenase